MFYNKDVYDIDDNFYFIVIALYIHIMYIFILKKNILFEKKLGARNCFYV